MRCAFDGCAKPIYAKAIWREIGARAINLRLLKESSGDCAHKEAAEQQRATASPGCPVRLAYVDVVDLANPPKPLEYTLRGLKEQLDHHERIDYGVPLGVM